MKKQPLSYAHASRKTEYTPGINKCNAFQVDHNFSLGYLFLT